MKSSTESKTVQKGHKLFLRHHDYVRLIAFIHAPDPALVEDVVNDSFIDFIQKVDQWDLEKDVRPLLAGIVRNIARQYWRKRSREMSDPLQNIYHHLIQRMEDEVDTFDREKTLAALHLCLQKLSPQNRSIIEHHYFLGETFVDMAKRLGKNLLTLRNIVFRIRTALKQCTTKTLDQGGDDV